MKLEFLFIFAFLAVLIQAAPSDYVQHVDTGCDSEFGNQVCHTTYAITNPTGTAVSIDTSNFKFKWRSELKPELADLLDSVQNVRIERWNGASWVNLNLAATVTLSAHTTYLIRISGTKLWKQIGENEWQMPKVDNVLSAFGHDYEEYAWWNSTWQYKRNVTVTTTESIAGAVYPISFNFSDQITAGKIDPNTYCVQLVDGIESSALAYEHESGNGTVNFTIWATADTLNSGANTRWIYYYNGSCEEQTNSPGWNASGVLATMLVNQNPQTTNAAPEVSNGYNWTVLSNLGLYKQNSPLGLAYNNFSKVNLLNGTYRIFNALNNGTVIVLLNITETSLNHYAIARGTNAAADFKIYYYATTHKFVCDLNQDNGKYNATSQTVPDLNRWYVVACRFDGQNVSIFINGTMEESTPASTYGVLAAQPSYFQTIGALTPSGSQNWVGAISNVLYFARNLTANEIKLISDMSLSNYVGTQEFVNTSGGGVGVPAGNLTLNVFDETTGQSIFFNGTIANSTASITMPNNNTYFKDFTIAPTGSVIISIVNASYYPRSFYQTFNINSVYNISTYLLSNTNPNVIFVRFHVSNGVGGAITNALVSLGVDPYLVGQVYTDASGIASFYMDITKSYNVTVDAIGYTSLTNHITPAQNDYYISLGDTSSTSFQFTFTNISWSLTPDPRILYLNSSIINFSIFSADSSLQYYGLALEYNGTIIFNQSNYTPASGGQILVNVNISNKTGIVFAHPYFKKVGFLEFYDSSAPFFAQNGTTKHTVNNTGTAGEEIGAKASLGLSEGAFALILLFFGMLLTGVLAKYVGIGGGVFGLIIIAMIAYFGVFSPSGSGIGPDSLAYWGIFTFLILIVASIIYIRWGGTR